MHLQFWIGLAKSLIHGWIGRNKIDVDVLQAIPIIHILWHTILRGVCVDCGTGTNHCCILCGDLWM